jgi:uncharacterized protein
VRKFGLRAHSLILDPDIKFDWDEANIAHIARHRVKPQEVEWALLHNPMYLDYEIVHDEERWTSLGHTDVFRVIIVVWTMRQGAMRAITARDAPKGVKSEYLEFIGFAK